MSDSKSQYSGKSAAGKVLAEHDAMLKGKLERARGRAKQFRENWQTVNLNDFTARFAPGSTAKREGSKIIFEADGSDLQVVCDIAAGSCRLMDKTIKSKRRYLDVNGNPVGNKTLPSGRKTGMTKPEYNGLTHFRILKRGEMDK